MIMARPLKKGLDYFPTDVSIFRDRKIRGLIRKAGPGAVEIYIWTLCEIYGTEGDHAEFSDDFVFDCANDFGIQEDRVREVLEIATEIGLFDSEAMADGVLTSESVKNRFNFATQDREKDRERKKTAKTDFQPEKGVFHPENPVFHPENPVFRPESAQRKEKKRILINKQTNKQENAGAREEDSPPADGGGTEEPEGINPRLWRWAREVIRRRIWERGMATELIDAVTMAGVLGWINGDTITEWLRKARTDQAMFAESRGRIGHNHRWETIRSELSIVYGEHGETLPAFDRFRPEPEPDKTQPLPERPVKNQERRETVANEPQ